MNRRGFIRAAAGALLVPAAPAIVRAESLMRVRPRDAGLVLQWDRATLDAFPWFQLDQPFSLAGCDLEIGQTFSVFVRERGDLTGAFHRCRARVVRR